MLQIERRESVRRALLMIVCMAVVMLGCRGRDQEQADRAAPVTEDVVVNLHIQVVNDPDLAQAIRREWGAITEGEITITEVNEDQWVNDQSSSESARTDVYVFPPRLLGEMVSRNLIRPLPRRLRSDVGADTNEGESEGSDPFDLQDFFSLLRHHEMTWGKQLYAISIGSPQLTFMYRKDIFEKLKISAPTTWEEYSGVLAKLASNDGLRTIGADLHPTAEPHGEGWAAKMFLARAAVYAKNPSQYSCLFSFNTMKPRLDTLGFVRALEEMRGDQQFLHPDCGQLNPQGVVELLLSGKVAIALAWPSAFGVATQDTERPALPIAFSPLPGATQFYDQTNERWEPRANTDSATVVPLLAVDGQCAGLGRGAKNSSGAMQFLSWLSGRDTEAALVANQSPHTTLFRFSQTISPNSWVQREFSSTAKQYGDVVALSHRQTTAISAPRIPGQHRYMATLDNAIRKSLDSDLSAKDSLTAVCQQWDAITDKLGRKLQRSAYEKSLGIGQ